MIAAVGCSDLSESMNTERKPANPTGIASSTDVADVQQATGGAVSKMTASPAVNAAAPNSPPTAPGVTSAKPDAGTVPAAQPKPKGFIPKAAAKVVDMSVALQNSNIQVSENKITGNDPLSAAASAYVTQGARIQMLNFKNSIKTQKAINGKNPTFTEFMKIVKQHKIEFNAMPPYRMYGYDPKTGGIAILEDKAEKARLYKEAGIPLD